MPKTRQEYVSILKETLKSYTDSEPAEVVTIDLNVYS